MVNFFCSGGEDPGIPPSEFPPNYIGSLIYPPSKRVVSKGELCLQRVRSQRVRSRLAIARNYQQCKRAGDWRTRADRFMYYYYVWTGCGF